METKGDGREVIRLHSDWLKAESPKKNFWRFYFSSFRQ